MEAYILDWLNLLARWLHFITGIAWIGSSFYFIWLDNHLETPRDAADRDQGVSGEVWSVHGGGFYHARKFQVAPPALPATLHWFKWEAYTTWLSGMFLLILIYWYGAEVYLIDPAVADLSAPVAVAIAAAFIVGGWFVYDLLCRTALGRNETLFGAVLLVLVALLAWALCELFGGRGAYIHFGVVLGTIWWRMCFRNHSRAKAMVAAFERNETPDPEPGINAKQRSVHNTYFTLPVLFAMTSNHFAMTYAHEYNWASSHCRFPGRRPHSRVLRRKAQGQRITSADRHCGFASRRRGRTDCAAFDDGVSAQPDHFDDVRRVVHERCTTCHSAEPTHPRIPGGTGRCCAGQRRTNHCRGVANSSADRCHAGDAHRQPDQYQ